MSLFLLYHKCSIIQVNYMNLSYKKIKFIISLSKKVNFSIPVPFLFRSVIGNQLRKICCIAHNNVCPTCMFNASCIYGLTFESIVPTSNNVLIGRNRISHPIIISAEDFTVVEQDSLILEIIFIGLAIPYLPYFYYALKKGGESGILKERVNYKISDVIELFITGEERSLIIDEQNINTKIEPQLWEFNPKTETINQKSYKITLMSPLRFIARGHLAGRLVESEFATCLHRRTQVLCSQYGHNDFEGDYQFLGNWAITEQNIKWQDYVHYSARQKRKMRLGGLTGDFTLTGEFSSYEQSFLQFAQLFHGGKNTNFGLGKIKVEEYGRL